MAFPLVQGSTYRWAFKLFGTGTSTPATGKTVAITCSKNGAAPANPHSGSTPWSATEIGGGYYYWDFDATDLGTLGPFIPFGTCAGCDTADRPFYVVPGAVSSGVGYPSTNSAYAGGVLVTQYDNTAQAVSANSITLAAPSSDARTAYDLTGWEVEIVTATTGAGQRGLITSSNLSVPTVPVFTIGGGWSGGITPTGVATYNLFSKINYSLASKTGFVLAAAGFDAVPIGSVNFRQATEIMAGMLAGATSGQPTAPNFGRLGYGTTIASASIDNNGNRSNVSLYPPS